MAELDNTVDTSAEEVVNTPENANSVDESAEIARLKAELAKANNKNDALAKENAEQKKTIRAKQSAEEAAAEAEKERQEAIEKELADLRRERAVANTSKKVFTFVQDEQISTDVAEYLFGAEDVDSALDAISKAWNAREKKLRLEYGKIPSPGIGSGNGPTITREELDKMSYVQRVEFANKNPAEYEKLMGRT